VKYMMETRPAGAQLPELRTAENKKNVIGVLINPLDRRTAADLIMAAAQQPRPFSVSAIAVHGVMTGVLDREHQYRLNQLDMIVADGQPVRWALNHLYHAGLAARVYGPFLTLEVLERAEQEEVSVYFYGSTPEVLELLCRKMKQRFPRLKIAGVQASKFRKITPEEADQISYDIRRSGAQVVFVGLGCPRQEVWAYEFRDRLNMPIVAVGAAFPFLAGELRMAPKWMQDRGLEWLFRLCMEPRRLWRRYLLLSPAYLALVFCQLIGFKFRSEGKEPRTEILYG
jgi:N-acetylglucosaminyldiphosphoundecaprenol N-acetyl-beta-D-mannosaminyltransferase